MVLRKHTSFKLRTPESGKKDANSATSLRGRQGCSRLGCVPASGRQCSPHASTLVRWKRGFLSSAKDGLVEIHSHFTARRFSCARAAWAYMGSEGVPIGLQLGATLVVELVRNPTSDENRGER